VYNAVVKYREIFTYDIPVKEFDEEAQEDQLA
ncbi:hypothetical protein KIPB_004411, partial [Kipferlia bialata]